MIRAKGRHVPLQVELDFSSLRRHGHRLVLPRPLDLAGATPPKRGTPEEATFWEEAERQVRGSRLLERVDDCLLGTTPTRR